MDIYNSVILSKHCNDIVNPCTCQLSVITSEYCFDKIIALLNAVMLIKY